MASEAGTVGVEPLPPNERVSDNREDTAPLRAEESDANVPSY